MRWWVMVALGSIACADAADKSAVGDDDDDVVGDDDDVSWPDACQSGGPDAPPPEEASSLEIGEFEGFATYTWLPENPRGLFVFFHGGADVSEVVQTEPGFFFDFMLAEGFGMVATQRTAPGGESNWSLDDFDRNDDAQRVGRLLDDVRASHGLSADLPIVTIGFSDGGMMAMRMAALGVEEGWPILATLVHGGGFGNLAGPVPTMLLSGENDLPNISDRIASEVEADGHPGVALELPERVVTPAQFERLGSAWDLARREELVAELTTVGLIDEQGVRLVDTDVMERSLALWRGATELQGAAFAESRMRVLWATHRFNAYEADAECQFVLDAL